MAREFLVYLAGPIKNLSSDEATGWRNYVLQQFELLCPAIRCLSPMRSKPYLAGEQALDSQHYEYPLSTDKGICSRNRFDCQRADLVLFNFTSLPDEFSAGTCIEIGWADAKRIPMVGVAPKKSVWAQHGMVRQLIPFLVETLDEVVELVPAILLPERMRSAYQVGW
jgi:nucleoside 2-deoxyribosyltransferase